MRRPVDVRELRRWDAPQETVHKRLSTLMCPLGCVHFAVSTRERRTMASLWPLRARLHSGQSGRLAGGGSGSPILPRSVVELSRFVAPCGRAGSDVARLAPDTPRSECRRISNPPSTSPAAQDRLRNVSTLVPALRLAMACPSCDYGVSDLTNTACIDLGEIDYRRKLITVRHKSGERQHSRDLGRAVDRNIKAVL